jgi:hypothetical protein
MIGKNNIILIPIDIFEFNFYQTIPSDFIDVFLKEVRKTTNPKSAFYGKLGGKTKQSVIL